MVPPMPLLKMTSIIIFSSSCKGGPLIGQLVSKGVSLRPELVVVISSPSLVLVPVSEEDVWSLEVIFVRWITSGEYG